MTRRGRSPPCQSPLVTHHLSLITPFQLFYLAAQFFDAREKLAVAALVARRLVAFDEEGAAGLQHAALHVFEVLEALTVRDRLKLADGQKLSRERPLADLAVLYERRRLAFEHLVEPPVAEHEPHDEVVHAEQRDRADESARERVVVAYDRVLDGVREREQYD